MILPIQLAICIYSYILPKFVCASEFMQTTKRRQTVSLGMSENFCGKISRIEQNVQKPRNFHPRINNPLFDAITDTMV